MRRAQNPVPGMVYRQKLTATPWYLTALLTLHWFQHSIIVVAETMLRGSEVMKFCQQLAVLLWSISLLCGCSGDSSSNPAPDYSRSYYMGFTPWPYDATLDAVNITYQKIQQDGDIVHHQLMQGIPWEAAFNGTPYPAGVEADITMRLNQTVAGHTILLSIDSLDSSRAALANNWGDSGEGPRIAPWDTRDLDSPEVITAYTNFALDLIDRFRPAYFNYGTEASELILNDIARYNKFVVFAQQVSANIKAQYPELKLMVSVALKSPGSAEMNLIKANIGDLLPYIDVLGISVYPYIFFNHADKGNPGNLPVNWLTQVEDFAAGKPIAITETGWIAQDLVVSGLGVNVPGSEAYQRQYVAQLLQQCDQLSVEFVIWWSLIDYQALWEGVLAQDDLAAIWRDTGLYDEQVQQRSGLAEWQQYFQRPKL